MSRNSTDTRALNPRTGAILGAVVAVALLWVFWPSFVTMASRWGDDPRYSHGYLVPVFSLYLLWAKRKQFATDPLCPNSLGLPLVMAGLAMRFAGTYLFYEWISAFSLLPCLAGLALLVGGWSALKKSWTAIAFLVFMVPLPFQVEVALAHPLQRIATKVSTYALQTLGFVAIAEGNTIRMGNVRLGVVEACSGLSMLVIFFALSTAVAILIRRPLYEKILIFVSAIPIALAANITRITVTGVLHKTVSAEVADRVFHDLAGWLMMPLALGLMWAELKLFAWIIKDRPRREPKTYRMPEAAKANGSPKAGGSPKAAGSPLAEKIASRIASVPGLNKPLTDTPENLKESPPS